ncbi:unnamed protein product [Larinioides sclopetarius]|uniref:Uncharacterized protein n=1 Tax=Larinioides sclopetarius TaxID=280406 RepID=A0AAV2BWG6_9ARAC
MQMRSLILVMYARFSFPKKVI